MGWARGNINGQAMDPACSLLEPSRVQTRRPTSDDLGKRPERLSFQPSKLRKLVQTGGLARGMEVFRRRVLQAAIAKHPPLSHLLHSLSAACLFGASHSSEAFTSYSNLLRVTLQLVDTKTYSSCRSAGRNRFHFIWKASTLITLFTRCSSLGASRSSETSTSVTLAA